MPSYVGCMSRSTALLRPFQRLPFARRNTAGGINYNKGVLTAQERGDSFTEPEVYRSKNNVSARVKVEKKTRFLLAEENKKDLMNKNGINSQREEQLRAGRRIPATPLEIDVTRAMDDEQAVAGTSDAVAQTYDSSLRQLMRREAARRDHMMDKFGQAPTSKEFYQLFRQLRAADDADETIEKYQKRLVEEHGIYPSTRADAFMLDDDGFFPEWVRALPYAIRDQVKYGALGLTEEDEALRVRLGRMPRDRRVQEWKRLKAAKEYRAANEETLTLAELRDARQGKRRFHWLQRKRQKRASTLRRMAMRKPEESEVWPSAAVDYSQKLAFVAQHVENGLETGGQWPLDSAALTRAAAKRKQDEADRTFLTTPDERPRGARTTVAGSLKDLLGSFDQDEKPFKRLSRKVYANRVNAVVHGDQDEYGRKYRKMHNRSTRRQRAYESYAEMALEREVVDEPSVHTTGLNHAGDERWTRHYKSWVDGMPSTRYGS